MKDRISRANLRATRSSILGSYLNRAAQKSFFASLRISIRFAADEMGGDGKMGFARVCAVALFCSLILMSNFCGSCAYGLEDNQTAVLLVNASSHSGMRISDTLFGVFFEEINHAGAGGLWAELVSNRGFEAGGPNTPSNIDPWSIIGNDSTVFVTTDRTSCFERNKVALRMEVLCDNVGSIICPEGGVGIYNPGYWGMNIEDGKEYKIILHVRTAAEMKLSVSLTSTDGSQTLASSIITTAERDISNWTKVELLFTAKGSNAQSRLQLTTSNKGIIWLDQISVMPVDTYKGHGFRKELFALVADLKPRFLRFPGGCFVEGEWLRNAFRWKETLVPWEERSGHFGDVWMYWTDEGLGYYEFLQLAEDLGASPVWVVNNGVSHNDQVATPNILAFVQDTLDSIEFARGSPNSTWGSRRTAMGHPEPFELKYVAVGNEDCGKKNYLGNYLKFYYAIKAAYPDIKIITNCDGSSTPLDHPADMYDFHIYTSSNNLFSMSKQFDHTCRSGPKAFVSEYAVTGSDAGKGSLLAALGEAGFLIGLERNSDVVEMASYAPLFVNVNDRRWNPDAIVFNSWQQYGTPSYWVQQIFKESSGAIYYPSTIQADSSGSLISSAILWENLEENIKIIKIKIVNFGSNPVNFKISITGLQGTINSSQSSITVLTSSNVMDENSFDVPNKVFPVENFLPNAGTEMNIVISPHSLTSINLPLGPTTYISAI
ncbi:alpha-L-arabinofuranosidase 1-like isoform X2 [Phalaenopsis equestris]|uniref:alpha-L-arabinofuranosidase 1-like isoform X2 n=1 Tax=Phalaenopsis equestris TaxID=78828 RepID=UPI0009E4288B|nr:alpha-L-arabinofuranosidase 1-like isoform X2 [Phalaenopsis equestris]